MRAVSTNAWEAGYEHETDVAAGKAALDANGTAATLGVIVARGMWCKHIAVANFAAEKPVACVAGLELRRAISSDGGFYCEQIRAFRIPPEFSGPCTKNVGCVAECLQNVSEASCAEFLFWSFINVWVFTTAPHTN